ncbi:hypothetical protein ABBQ38_002292 [Trebouxia sp. C0009 RCD-2024]
MATSMALGQLVHPLPQATTARFTPSRLCNARVHSQRQLISLRNFTPQQTCRCNQLRSVIQAAMHGDDWTTAPESYLTLGLGHCFEKTEEGKLKDKFVIEPITANSLECMAAGGKTCFKHVTSLTFEQAMSKDRSILPETFSEGFFCEDFEFRCGASARTWQRTHAQDNLLDIVPLGQNKSNFNYNLDEKRVLNFENVVDDSDNVKQDMSIDVYGRKQDGDDEPDKSEADSSDAKVTEEEAEDDMDALLSV